jgi:antitoxin component YwqK of YwqJK toxin-antitoxin module/Tfp pilus assembly protein PilF
MYLNTIFRTLTLVYLLFSRIATFTWAQTESSPFEKSSDIINAATKLHDEGKYDEAIQLYKKISLCDPDYPLACYEMALSYYAAGNFDEALNKCNEAILLRYEDPGIYGLIGSLLDDMGKPDEGIKLLEKAVKTWPYNQNILYNLALCYLNTGNPVKAEEVALKSLIINPYHTRTHLILAKANYVMGRIAQSYLAYNMVILLNPYLKYISEFENCISGKTQDVPLAYKYPYPQGSNHRKWDDLKWLIQSELAFKDEFEYNFNVSYMITRQSLMLFRKMNFDPADTSLFNQFYVRLFSEILNRGEFEIYINYLLQNTSDQTVADYINKNLVKIKGFVKWAQQYINTIRESGFSAQNEKENVKKFHYNDRGYLTAIGAEKNAKKQGIWLILSDNGYISEKGYYVNDKAEGDWYIYWPNGQIKEQIVFVNDIPENQIIYYFPNGEKAGITEVKNGMKNGTVETYSSSGYLLQKNIYSDNKVNGPGIYFNFGEGYSREFTYVNDSLEGVQTEKWLTGNLKSKCFYQNNQLQGDYHTWYPTGKKESEGFYIKGNKYGQWTNFHHNGNKKESAEYDTAGQVTGKYYAFDYHGNIIAEENRYINGKLTGKRIEYYPDGKKHNVMSFDNGRLTGIECYDTAGKLVYKATEQDSAFYFKSFYPDGILNLEGNIVKGQREGKWKQYTPAGVLKEEMNYFNGMFNGLQRTYYPHGQVSEEYYCDSNLIIGEYKAYYSNGKLKTSGFYNKNGKNGDWFTYFLNDSIESHAFYTDGIQTGRYILYYPGEKKNLEVFYNDENQPVRTIKYNHQEQVEIDMDYEFGSHHFETFYPSGKIKEIINITDRFSHGKHEKYFPNGLVAQRDSFIFGMQHGTSYSWNYQGQILTEIPYVLNVNEGLAKWYNEKGTPDYLSVFENGLIQGKVSDFHYNGQIYREMLFEQGNRSGYTDYYAPDGTFMYRLRFYDNTIKGYTYKSINGGLIPEIPVDTTTTEIICNYPNGRTAIRIQLKKCLYHGKLLSYYPTGILMRETTFYEDNIEGFDKQYFPNGKIRESIYYHNDDREGPYESYYENGQKHKQGQYHCDNETGEWKVYDENGRLKEMLYYYNGMLYDIVKY